MRRNNSHKRCKKGKPKHTHTSVSLRRLSRAGAMLLALAAFRSFVFALMISAVLDRSASATFVRMPALSSLDRGRQRETERQRHIRKREKDFL